MAEQKIAEKPRGKKKSDKKQADSGGSKAGRSSKRRVMNYWNRGHKAANVKSHKAKQLKVIIDANRPGQTERGHARAMRRANVALATGATSKLAAAERRLNPAPEEPTLDQQIAGTITELFGEAALARFEAEKAKAAAK